MAYRKAPVLVTLNELAQNLRQSRDTSVIYTPPPLQGLFSPHFQVMIDKQTHHDQQHDPSPTHEQPNITTYRDRQNLNPTLATTSRIHGIPDSSLINTECSSFMAPLH